VENCPIDSGPQDAKKLTGRALKKRQEWGLELGVRAKGTCLGRGTEGKTGLVDRPDSRAAGSANC